MQHELTTRTSDGLTVSLFHTPDAELPLLVTVEGYGLEHSFATSDPDDLHHPFAADPSIPDVFAPALRIEADEEEEVEPQSLRAIPVETIEEDPETIRARYDEWWAANADDDDLLAAA